MILRSDDSSCYFRQKIFKLKYNFNIMEDDLPSKIHSLIKSYKGLLKGSINNFHNCQDCLNYINKVYKGYLSRLKVDPSSIEDIFYVYSAKPGLDDTLGAESRIKLELRMKINREVDHEAIMSGMYDDLEKEIIEQKQDAENRSEIFLPPLMEELVNGLEIGNYRIIYDPSDRLLNVNHDYSNAQRDVERMKKVIIKIFPYAFRFLDKMQRVNK
jgi:hypothetical protein